MKLTRKVLAVLLACLCLTGALSFAACGTGSTEETSTDISAAITALPADDPADTASSEDAPSSAPEADPAEDDVSPAPSAEAEAAFEPAEESSEEEALPDEHGSYTTAEDVALFLHVYGHLPDNFITKKEARALGWEGGSVEKYAPGMCIGGDTFGNYEGRLPTANGRTWHECDINTLGAGSRGAERLLYSTDGLIYYTNDHYETFTLLYGDPDA